MSTRVPKPRSRARSKDRSAAGSTAGPRALAKARTRDALIDAGLALFARDGVDAPSLDAICERAGYTRGAFYVHFRDRDAFLVAAMDRAGRRFLDSVLPTTDGAATDLPASIARFVASVADGSYPLGPAGGVRPHQLLAACARSTRIRRRYVELVQEAIARVEQIVKAGQRDAIVRDDLPADEVAVLLLAATIGAHTLLELRAPIDLGRSAAVMWTALAPSAGRVTDRRDNAASAEHRRARSARPTRPRPAGR